MSGHEARWKRANNQGTTTPPLPMEDATCPRVFVHFNVKYMPYEVVKSSTT